MSRIPFLPTWIYPAGFTSVYDAESQTASERTARLDGAVRALIEDYNKFTEELTEEIKNFTAASTAEIDEFKRSIEERMRCKFQDLDAKISSFNISVKTLVAEEAERVYADHVDGYIDQVINEKIASGEIKITLVYDPETESLNIAPGGDQ